MQLLKDVFVCYDVFVVVIDDKKQDFKQVLKYLLDVSNFRIIVMINDMLNELILQ